MKISEERSASNCSIWYLTVCSFGKLELNVSSKLVNVLTTLNDNNLLATSLTEDGSKFSPNSLLTPSRKVLKDVLFVNIDNIFSLLTISSFFKTGTM